MNLTMEQIKERLEARRIKCRDHFFEIIDISRARFLQSAVLFECPYTKSIVCKLRDADSASPTISIEILSIKRPKTSYVSLLEGKRKTPLHFEIRFVVDDLNENREQAGINIDNYLKSMFASMKKQILIKMIGYL